MVSCLFIDSNNRAALPGVSLPEFINLQVMTSKEINVSPFVGVGMGELSGAVCKGWAV